MLVVAGKSRGLTFLVWDVGGQEKVGTIVCRNRFHLLGQLTNPLKNIGATTLAIVHSRYGRNYICSGLRGLVSFLNTYCGIQELWHSLSSFSCHLHRIHYCQHHNHHHIYCCHLIYFNFLCLSDLSLLSSADKTISCIYVESSQKVVFSTTLYGWSSTLALWQRELGQILKLSSQRHIYNFRTKSSGL